MSAGIPGPGTHRLLREGEGAGAGPLRYTVHVPDQARGLVLALHYGFDPGAPFPPWYGAGLLDALVRPALEGEGLVLLAPDSGGAPWTEPALQDRVLALAGEIAAALAIPGEARALLGYSLGGMGVWSLLARADVEVPLAIPISAPVPPGLEARALLPPARPPPAVRAVHGRGDELFPFPEVEAGIARLAAGGADVRLLPVEGATHFDVGGFVEALRALVPELRRRLGHGPDP